MVLETRLVQLPADEPFLFKVYAGTREAELAAWGWDEQQQRTFLLMQFTAQQRSYGWQYPDATHSILLHDGQEVGQVRIAHVDGMTVLVDIALLPECRGRGIGAMVLQRLQAEATRSGRFLRLRVTRENPAGRLYERLGFVITDVREPYCTMEWRPDSD